jgi:ATP-dependent DNA helicase RecG
MQLKLTFSKASILLSPDEIYEALDGELLGKVSEDRRLERKPPGIHGEVLGDYFSMWANTPPDGGLIIVGIGDNGVLSGCHKLPTKHLNALDKAAHTYCPLARVQTKQVKVIAADGSDGFVFAMRVQYAEDKVVKTVKGEAFIRRGDQKHKLTHEEIHELAIDRRQLDIEKEPVPELTFPDDFDLDLIRRFVDGVKRVHEPLQQYLDVEVLEQRRLGKIKNGKFIPNNACVLVFAKDPLAVFPGCSIKFLRFDGEYEESGDRYNAIKTIPVEGSVPTLIAEAARILDSQLREFSRLGGDGLFYTAPEYPRDAWYEALVNACVHRSYGLKTMNIFVKMFDDKLVIESPGGFPPLVTPENIYRTHNPRNPTLMKAMWYLGLVKEHAEGTKRMRDTMAGMRLPPPEFAQVESGIGYAAVHVTLRNHIKQRKVWVDKDVANVLGDALAANLNPNERRVLNFVAEHGRINVVQCHELIPALPKWHAAKRLLLKMTDRGLLKHVHSKNVLRDNRAHFTLPDAFKGLKK